MNDIDHIKEYSDRAFLYDVELAIKMLEKETELRLSDETIEEYSKENIGYNYKRVNIQIQKTVLEHFGFESSEYMLDQYRKIRAIYSGNERISEAALFIKFDYSPSESLYEGDTIPDANVSDLEGNIFNLKTFIKNESRMVFLIGGTVS
eukprot:TRINITY_DN3107_c0_g1_i1.p1 TRINITY_DN3107_c0_g1~~TRINITY_DN3107_c0_g1_i1.p1  ORF type:complete len:149 (+),score=35.00 TRINITY_DN3107_c0_g1_i1:41-487(+)